jgi:hypothetical protein
MKVNVYGEELTDQVEVLTRDAKCGHFTGARFVQAGEFSSITFWSKSDLRVMFRRMLEALDKHYAAEGEGSK